MQNTELLIHLAEIAGVFVGFGALISVRSDAVPDEEVMMIRMIVVFGIRVVVAALFPVLVSSFGVTGHGLWATSAAVFLFLFWAAGILDRWDVERKRVLGAVTRRERIRMEIPAVPLWISMNIALVLILTGQFPDQEPALYLTAVALDLFLTAAMLVYLVYWRFAQSPALGGAAAHIEVDALAGEQETPPGAEGRPHRREPDPRDRLPLSRSTTNRARSDDG